MSLPSVNVVRKRILRTTNPKVKVCLMCAYLFGCRISELVGIKSPRDTTVARGPRGTDVRTDVHNDEEVSIFRLKTAKRDGLIRLIALPLNPKYERWTKLILHYYERRGESLCFPFTRQKVGTVARDIFKGLRYPIAKYTESSRKGMKKVVFAHNRPFNIHALRHLRTTELVEVYGFDGFDLSIFGGWKLSSTTGINSSIDRYTHLQWQRYFPKLLRERTPYIRVTTVREIG